MNGRGYSLDDLPPRTPRVKIANYAQDAKNRQELRELPLIAQNKRWAAVLPPRGGFN